MDYMLSLNLKDVYQHANLDILLLTLQMNVLKLAHQDYLLIKQPDTVNHPAHLQLLLTHFLILVLKYVQVTNLVKMEYV